MTVRLGIAPIGWTNDDLPELGGDIPLERCLREARQAGAAEYFTKPVDLASFVNRLRTLGT